VQQGNTGNGNYGGSGNTGVPATAANSNIIMGVNQIGGSSLGGPNTNNPNSRMTGARVATANSNAGGRATMGGTHNIVGKLKASNITFDSRGTGKVGNKGNKMVFNSDLDDVKMTNPPNDNIIESSQKIFPHSQPIKKAKAQGLTGFNFQAQGLSGFEPSPPVEDNYSLPKNSNNSNNIVGIAGHTANLNVKTSDSPYMNKRGSLNGRRTSQTGGSGCSKTAGNHNGNGGSYTAWKLLPSTLPQAPPMPQIPANQFTAGISSALGGTNGINAHRGAGGGGSKCNTNAVKADAIKGANNAIHDHNNYFRHTNKYYHPSSLTSHQTSNKGGGVVQGRTEPARAGSVVQGANPNTNHNSISSKPGGISNTANNNAKPGGVSSSAKKTGSNNHGKGAQNHGSGAGTILSDYTQKQINVIVDEPSPAKERPGIFTNANLSSAVKPQSVFPVSQGYQGTQGGTQGHSYQGHTAYNHNQMQEVPTAYNQNYPDQTYQDVLDCHGGTILNLDNQAPIHINHMNIHEHESDQNYFESDPNCDLNLDYLNSQQHQYLNHQASGTQKVHGGGNTGNSSSKTPSRKHSHNKSSFASMPGKRQSKHERPGDNPRFRDQVKNLQDGFQNLVVTMQKVSDSQEFFRQQYQDEVSEEYL
jgi:hypothetical protein